MGFHNCVLMVNQWLVTLDKQLLFDDSNYLSINTILKTKTWRQNPLHFAPPFKSADDFPANQRIVYQNQWIHFATVFSGGPWHVSVVKYLLGACPDGSIQTGVPLSNPEKHDSFLCGPIVGVDYFKGQRKQGIAHLPPLPVGDILLLHKSPSTMKHHQPIIQMKLIKPLDYLLTKHDSTTINLPIQTMLDHVLSNHYSATTNKPSNKPNNKPTNQPNQPINRPILTVN